MKTIMTTIAFASAALGMAAAPARALEVAKTVEASATPAAVWAAVGDFCGIAAWHPAVEACSAKIENGAEIRTLTLGNNGGMLVEQLVSRDDAAMSYTYKILDGPLPVENYQSTLRVKPDADGDEAEIEWRGTFDAKGASDADAAKVIEGIYDAGLAALVEASAK